jgi:hypothetical protein
MREGNSEITDESGQLITRQFGLSLREIQGVFSVIASSISRNGNDKRHFAHSRADKGKEILVEHGASCDRATLIALSVHHFVSQLSVLFSARIADAPEENFISRKRGEKGETNAEQSVQSVLLIRAMIDRPRSLILIRI